MKQIILTISILIVLNTLTQAMELDQSIEKKIDAIINQMTLEEKADMLGGDTTSFDSKPLSRLGIPALRMTDGPNGVRWGKSTAFPVGVCIAATWDTDLVYELGQALGRETKARERNVLLGPCVNIHRDAHAGRNFESYGEDPYLAGRIAVAWVKGLQSEKVVATTKHFACNNQEYERTSMDSKVDERTLREIYFPAFKAAVQEGNTWSIMSAYNRLNGQYASSNTWLLRTILKEEWGFQGFVMSDWGAVHSIVPTMYAGMDIEMPNGRYMSRKNVLEAIYEGRMKESKVDDKVRRMLRTMFAMGYFDQEIPAGGASHTDEHLGIARRVAESGIVLLKNDQALLPLNPNQLESIAIIGPNAATLRTGGGGSSMVDPIEAKSPLDAIREMVSDVDITYTPGMIVPSELKAIQAENLQTPDGKPGLFGEYFNNSDFEGEPFKTQIDGSIDWNWDNGSPEGVPSDYFSMRWTGKLTAHKTGQYLLGISSDDGSRLYIDGELIIDNWGDHAIVTKTAPMDFVAGESKDIELLFYEHAGGAAIRLQWQKVDEAPIDPAIQAAEAADAVLMFMGFSYRDETEGKDRDSNAFPKAQLELLERVSAVNDKVVVIINSGAGVLMQGWGEKVPAIIESWYPGEQGGQAIANILFGKVNPSGKLVTSFFKDEQDSPTYNNYPGADDELIYEEGLFVGYRHYDAKQIDPLYAFGHGLSYTEFEYSDLKLSARSIKHGESIEVNLKVTNTGASAGAEVVQLYLKDDKSSVVRPEKELKGFSKVFLEPGETKEISMELKPDAMKFWDINTSSWIAETGKFRVLVGASSRDIRLKGSYKLK